MRKAPSAPLFSSTAVAATSLATLASMALAGCVGTTTKDSTTDLGVDTGDVTTGVDPGTPPPDTGYTAPGLWTGTQPVPTGDTGSLPGTPPADTGGTGSTN